MMIATCTQLRRHHLSTAAAASIVARVRSTCSYPTTTTTTCTARASTSTFPTPTERPLQQQQRRRQQRHCRTQKRSRAARATGGSSGTATAGRSESKCSPSSSSLRLGRNQPSLDQTPRDQDHDGPHARHGHDCYSRHRRAPPDSALLSEYAIETNRTAKALKQRLMDTWGIDRSVILREIEAAASLVHEGEETAEVGPAGLYRYYADDGTGGEGVRTYRRFPAHVSDREGEVAGHGTTTCTSQVVLRVNYQLERPGPMSLSVDEEYVVYLTVPTLLGPQQGTTHKSKIVVRHIDSGKEFVLRGGGGGGGVAGKIVGRAHTVEFGPSYRTSNGSTKHDLYFTTCNDLGRPDSVYCVTFDTVSGFGTIDAGAAHQQPELHLVLHDSNEANFVDVSRTKGREFVVVQSTSKVSNEVYLVGSRADDEEEEEGEDGCGKAKVVRPILVRKREEGVQYYVECGPDEDDVFVLAHRTTTAEDDCNHLKEEEGERSDCDLLGEEMSIFQTSLSALPLVGSMRGDGGADCRPIHLHRRRSRTAAVDDDGGVGVGAGCPYFVEEMDLFANYVALYERSAIDGRQRIRVLDRRRGTAGRGREEDSDLLCVVPLPEESGHHDGCAVISLGGNIHYEATTLRFSVEGPALPPATYVYNMEMGTLRRVASSSLDFHTGKEDGAVTAAGQTTVLPECTCTRVMVTSSDGTAVPLTLVGTPKESTEREGEGPHQSDKTLLRTPEDTFGRHRPTILVGYGSYGQVNSMAFDPTIAPLINRGFIVAYAHTRGGGELGRSWYRRGRLHDKERAVKDYVACAEALVGELNITTPQQLGAKAFSAGGVLAAAATNASPSLFSAVALTNPFLDVMGAMSDPTLPLTEHEKDEWGDPATDAIAAETIRRYCPFTNILPQAYPSTLLVGAIDDENVPCWHPITYSMKRRRARIQERGGNVMLHLEEHGGHHLHGRRLDVASLECSFLLGELSRVSIESSNATKPREKSSLFSSITKLIF